MKIKAIYIKNVRGIQDHSIPLNMIPNKPSLLVAPNGSGKSSFAFAFQWLNRLRMKLNVDDAFNGDITNKPQLTIETIDPNEILIATEHQNSISKKFGVYVINSGLFIKSPGYKENMPMGKAKLTVPDVVLIDNLSPKNTTLDDFDSVYDTTECATGLFPVVNALLINKKFMGGLDISYLKTSNKNLKSIYSLIEKVKSAKGSIETIHKDIEGDDYDRMQEIPSLSYVIDNIKRVIPQKSDAKCLLKAIRIVTFYYRKKDDFRDKIKYYSERLQIESYRRLFSVLKKTWKGITPKEEHGKFLISFGDVRRISNGERDLLVFLSKLLCAEKELNKKHNILIIDEVFDYLDDANLMVAQYYITRFITRYKKEGRFIYPIILSHLNPDYYNQHYSFKDLKVYYLSSLPYPHASDNMMKLLRRRKDLAQAAGVENEDNISKYMLHFYPDYSMDMSTDLGTDLPMWHNIENFKNHCSLQLEGYLTNQTYDPLAVCVALREIIESYIHRLITNSENKDKFIEIHGTLKKMEYAESIGVDVPEIFYLLGNLYNDPMHVDNKSNKSIAQTLYSRMENNAIRGIIGNLRGKYA